MRLTEETGQCHLSLYPRQNPARTDGWTGKQGRNRLRDFDGNELHCDTVWWNVLWYQCKQRREKLPAKLDYSLSGI
jgi:hypothetical protein